MKNSAIALLGVALLLFAPTEGSAQRGERGGGQGGPGQRVSAVGYLIDQADALDLSEAQRTGLQEILDELAVESQPTLEAMNELRQSGDREAMRSQGRPMMEELMGFEEDALGRALDLMEGDQRAAAETMVETFQAERPRRGRRGGKGNGPPSQA